MTVHDENPVLERTPERKYSIIDWLGDNAIDCILWTMVGGMSLLHAALVSGHDPSLPSNKPNAHAMVAGIYFGFIVIVSMMSLLNAGDDIPKRYRAFAVFACAHAMVLALVSAIGSTVF